jgi:hypothetical protein
MSDENRAVFESGPARILWSRAKRMAFRGARFVALAAFALCAAIGAVALLSFWLFASDRPLLRELHCLTPEAFDRPDRANVSETDVAETSVTVARLRPIPEIRLVLVDRGGQELLLCAAADRLGETPAVPPGAFPAPDGRPEILTTLFVRVPERGAVPVPVPGRLSEIP